MSSPPPLSSIRLQVRSGARDPLRFPQDDDALGESLFDLFSEALEQGLPRPALLVFRPEQVEQIDALPIMRLPPPLGMRLMSAAAGQDGVDCVALVAALTVRTGPRTGARAAVVYLEWPDNRWWSCWQPMDDRRELLGDEPAVRRAVEGWPKPGGLGGWFAMARRLGLRLQVRPVDQTEAGETIH